jgi:hypothetical protein
MAHTISARPKASVAQTATAMPIWAAMGKPDAALRQQHLSKYFDMVGVHRMSPFRWRLGERTQLR